MTTFGSRIAGSSLLPPYVPLVFSARPGEQPPPFFWQMLAHFGVPRERVRIVAAPVVFDTLSVLPQSERLFGKAPSPSYLDLLDELSGPAPDVDGSKIYVSRAGMWKGKVAGESYLGTVLEHCGFRVFRPENHTLEDQLATYRRASHLIFAEGSALHGLQLLGRIAAEVTVIVRRNGARLARSAIAARVSSLSYIDAIHGVVHGVGSNGRALPSAGITLVDTGRLVAELERRGVAIGQWWNDAEFRHHQSHDLNVWVVARFEHPPHHRDRERIEGSLRRSGLQRTALAGTPLPHAVGHDE